MLVFLYKRWCQWQHITCENIPPDNVKSSLITTPLSFTNLFCSAVITHIGGRDGSSPLIIGTTECGVAPQGLSQYIATLRNRNTIVGTEAWDAYSMLIGY